MTEATQVNGRCRRASASAALTIRSIRRSARRGIWRPLVTAPPGTTKRSGITRVGTKSTILGGRGTVNVSGFYMDIRNLQATVTAGSCSSRVIFNVPDAPSAGLEFEVAAQPTPLFDVALSASVADARLQSTLESYDAAGHVTGIIAGIEDGKRLPTTPRFQMAVAATWRWVMGSRVGYLSGVYPARRIALHPDRRPGRGVRLRRLDSADPRVAPGHIHRGAADAEYLHLQSGTAGLQHPQHQDRGA